MENVQKTIKRLIWVFLGNTIMALGSGVFVIPNGLMTGGSTGLGIAVNHFAGIPIALTVGALNILLFFAGYWILGKTFAFTAMISTFYFPVALAHVQQLVPEAVTSDPMLAAVAGGLLTGLGIGMVIRAGASTGGMDIPPLILKKKIGLPVSVGLYAFDCLILLAQMIFSNLETALYGLVLVLIYTIVIDKVSAIGLTQMQAKSISEKHDEISQAIQTELDRGTTFLAVKGGWKKNDTYAVMVVLSGRELVKLNELVMRYDPNAFMIVSKVNEVRGRGFTMKKKHVPSKQ